MEKKSQDLEQEFTRIAQEYKETIYMVCYMFSKDSQQVDDLYQEILINIWKSLPTFQGRSSLKTWIWRLSLNTCISYDRKRSSRASLLHERINRLGVFDRAIIMLWLENMPYEEIGAIVGISAKNVGVRLVRIREQLKNMK